MLLLYLLGFLPLPVFAGIVMMDLHGKEEITPCTYVQLFFVFFFFHASARQRTISLRENALKQRESLYPNFSGQGHFSSSVFSGKQNKLLVTTKTMLLSSLLGLYYFNDRLQIMLHLITLTWWRQQQLSKIDITSFIGYKEKI